MFRIVRTKTLRAYAEWCASVTEAERVQARQYGERVTQLKARIEAARQAAGNDTNRASVRRMLAALNGEAAEAPKPKVDAGPLPEEQYAYGSSGNLRNFRAGGCTLTEAFIWDTSYQGWEYWHNAGGHNAKYADLPPEPKAIIDAWCAQLEAQK